MRLIGVDASISRTGVGIIDLDRGEVTSFSIPTKKKEATDVRMMQALDGVLQALHPGDVVIMEDFGMASLYSVSSLVIERIELAALLKYKCPEVTGYPILLAMPSHLKGFIAGKVSAHKAEVRLALKEIWGIDSGNTDESDGLSLALLAKNILIPGELDKKRLGLVEKARKYRTNPQALQKYAYLMN